MHWNVLCDHSCMIMHAYSWIIPFHSRNEDSVITGNSSYAFQIGTHCYQKMYKNIFIKKS